jgi:hypothetical protein
MKRVRPLRQHNGAQFIFSRRMRLWPEILIDPNRKVEALCVSDLERGNADEISFAIEETTT